MSTNISILDRCTGAMLGSAIGDALGWPNENRSGNIHKLEIKNDSFIRWSRRTGGKYWNHVEEILPGEYSDDTQLILAVSRSLISGNWQCFFSEKELPYWLEYERGGGSSVKKAAKILKSNKLPWKADTYREYFNAGGNGAVMRILPHVIVDSKNPNTPALMRDVIRDSIYTHGHPRAILGATCYAYLLQQLLHIEDTPPRRRSGTVPQHPALSFAAKVPCAAPDRQSVPSTASAAFPEAHRLLHNLPARAPFPGRLHWTVPVRRRL